MKNEEFVMNLILANLITKYLNPIWCDYCSKKILIFPRIKTLD